ncbi:hypothetical protein ACFWY5_57610 [Nonomuraea sp. NPDC059007]
MRTTSTASRSDLALDVRFTHANVSAAGIASEDCTGDECTGTDDSAGVTC